MKNNNQSNGATVNSKIDLGPKLRQAEVLLSISKKLAAFDVLDEMLTALVEITTKEVNADRGTIFLNEYFTIMEQTCIEKAIGIKRSERLRNLSS